MRQVVGFADRPMGRGTLGGEFRARHCNQWRLYGVRVDFRSDAAFFANYFGADMLQYYKGYPHSMMICAYLRMKLSSLKMKRDRVFVGLMPGRCNRVVLLAAPLSESLRPATVRPPPKSSPNSLSADKCVVILHHQRHITRLNPLKPTSSNYYTLPYRPSLPFLISDIRALWRSALSARVPECQKFKMVGLTSRISGCFCFSLAQRFSF